MTHDDDALRRAIEVALNEAAEFLNAEYQQWERQKDMHSFRHGMRFSLECIRALSPDDILKKVKGYE